MTFGEETGEPDDELVWKAEGILLAKGIAPTQTDAERLIISTANRLGMKRADVAMFVLANRFLPD